MYLVYRLTVSKSLGDVLYKHAVVSEDAQTVTYLQLLDIAHDVYSDVSCHVEAMMCFVARNDVDSVVLYAVNNAECTSKHLTQVCAVRVVYWRRFSVYVGRHPLGRTVGYHRNH